MSEISQSITLIQATNPTMSTQNYHKRTHVQRDRHTDRDYQIYTHNSAQIKKDKIIQGKYIYTCGDLH